MGLPGEVVFFENIPLNENSSVARALLLTGTRDLDELLDLCEGDQHVDRYFADEDNEAEEETDPDAFPFHAGTSTSARLPDDQPGAEAGVTRERFALHALKWILLRLAKKTHERFLRHRCDGIYFSGIFRRSRPRALNMLTRLFDSVTGGEIRPRFLRHDNHLVALGALIRNMQKTPSLEFIGPRLIENLACSALPEEPLGPQKLVVFDVENGRGVRKKFGRWYIRR